MANAYLCVFELIEICGIASVVGGDGYSNLLTCYCIFRGVRCVDILFGLLTLALRV